MASPPAAFATRHDSRSAAHLHRPTHGLELHRAAPGERRHHRHASGKANPTQDNQAHDTNCWNRSLSLTHTNEGGRWSTQFFRRTNASAARTAPRPHERLHFTRHIPGRGNTPQPTQRSSLTADRAHTTVPAETTSSLAPRLGSYRRILISTWKGFLYPDAHTPS
mgnify:CR=1 FL=1